MADQPLLLWSTNTLLKFRIQHQFFGQVHHVWCSPTFEAAAKGKYEIGRDQPASSDPASIYRALKAFQEQPDDHDSKVAEQKKVLPGLAVKYFDDGKISASQRDDIIAIVNAARPSDWSPVIYVIPYAVVASRVQEVPRDRRASHSPEFIVPDLLEHEFDKITP